MGATAEIPEQLSTAIEDLCKKDVEHLQLLDILTVSELMARSIRELFTTEDRTLYNETIMLAAYLSKAREELKRLRPVTLREEHLPVAGEEIEAIVSHTEEATNTIMESAEAIMGADTESADYQELVQDHVMKIFEACSFQDITGQRAQKVSEVINTASEQVGNLVAALGETHEETADQEEETEQERFRRENLLNGPQMEEEALQQDDVDEMFDQDDIDALFD